MKKRINPTDLDINGPRVPPTWIDPIPPYRSHKPVIKGGSVSDDRSILNAIKNPVRKQPISSAPWKAPAIVTPQAPRPKAYIFDIDATLLSSKGGPIFRGRADIPAFNNWALKGNAPAIPAGKKLYDQAIAEGAEIHLFTSREPLTKKATIRNLQEQGMGTFHGYYSKHTGMDSVAFKANIRAKLAKTHDIVATVGDLPTDFWGGNTGKAVRIVNEAHVSGFKRAGIEGLFQGPAAKRARKILSFGDAYYRPVAYAAAAATAAFVAIRLASGKRNDRQTQIVGLPSFGKAAGLRHKLTDFGSGWQGLESKTVRATPSRFLKLIGADAESIKATDLQHGRYQEPSQLQELIQAYKSGKTVEPVEILLDEAKNIIGAEGRHRALAAQMAGVEKFPIVLRRRVPKGVGFSISKAKNAVRQLSVQYRSNPSIRAAAMLGQREYYHGSKHLFAKPDVTISSTDNMFGPGFYTTSNFNVAKGYAETAAREGTNPNIRLEKLTPRKTFVLHERRPLSGQQYKDISDGYRSLLAKEGVEASKLQYRAEYLERWLAKMPSLEFYKNMSSMFGGDSHFREFLLDKGYDSIAHMGGMADNSMKHRVVIALKQDIVKTKAIMKLGEGQAIGKAGTAKIPAVLKAGARLIKNAI